MPDRVPLAVHLGPTFLCACLYSFVVVYCTWAGLRMFTKETSFEVVKLVQKTWLSEVIIDIQAVSAKKNCRDDFQQFQIDDLSGIHQPLNVWPVSLSYGEVLPMKLCKKVIRDYSFKELFQKTSNNCTIANYHSCYDRDQKLSLCIPDAFDGPECPINEIRFNKKRRDNIQEKTIFSDNLYLAIYRKESSTLSGLVFRKVDEQDDPFIISAHLEATYADIRRENSLDFNAEDNTKYGLYMLPVPQMTEECTGNMKFLRFLHDEDWLSNIVYWQKAGIILNIVFLLKVFLDIYLFDHSQPHLNIRHLQSSRNNKRYVLKYLVSLIIFGLIQAAPILFALQGLQDIMDFLNIMMENRCLDYKTFNPILKVNKEFIESCMTYDACNIGFFIVGVGALIWNWWSNFQDFEIVMDNQRQQRELDQKYFNQETGKSTFFEEIELIRRETAQLKQKTEDSIDTQRVEQEDAPMITKKQNNQNL